MALVVGNEAEGKVLEYIANKVAPTNLTLRLFVNDFTPSELMTAASLTEATGGGYAAIAAAGADWTVVTGAPSSMSTAKKTFTFTGALTTNTDIYGYYFTRVDGTLMWAERHTGTFTPAENGDNYGVTPNFTLE